MRDKDPNWRHQAVFTRAEVEQLISDERVPLDRRVFYALLFLTGMRVGEAVARRWRDIDTETEPLGTLTVGTHYLLEKRREAPATKTGVSRLVPIHPELARVLAEWKLRGFRAFLGRQPKPEDFIVPGARGTIRNAHYNLTLFHDDQELLGLRERRQHDARRTFISLGIADGARIDILRWVTHGAPGNVMGLYTTLPWSALCGEVSKLKVKRRGAAVTALLRPAVSPRRK